MKELSLVSEGDSNQSPERIKWQERNVSEKTAELLKRDSDVFLHQTLSTPCLSALAGAEGSYITDTDNKRYLDFHGNNVHQTGFSHPRIVNAMKKQLDELSFCTRRYTNEKAVELAEKLTSIAPENLNRVLFAPGGAEAVGMAVKLARIHTGRHKTISMWDSFHGATLDAISIGGEATFRKGIGPLIPGTEHAPPAGSYRCFYDCDPEHRKLKCADYIEYILEKEQDVCAVIAETVRSTPYFPPEGYWKKVKKACEKHGALLILDEIPTCLGRTGKMFACENYGVVPDMLVIGKGLGGGIMPLAALLADEKLNESAKDHAIGHYTHEKSPLAAACALAAIEVAEDEELAENARAMGAYALGRLNRLKEQFDFIGDVRGMGLMIGVELVKSRNTKEPEAEKAEKIMYLALDMGLNFKVTMGNILTLTPPLNITRGEMDTALVILEACFSEVSNG